MTVLVTAHRGDSSRYRENTLPAIRSAIEAGADFVEVDVRRTRDGEVVLLHDRTLERLWDLRRDISELDYASVARLGSGEERIPLLREALDLFHATGSTLLVDMDEADPAAAAYNVVSSAGVDVAWCGDLEGMRTIRMLDGGARLWLPWDHRRPPSAAELAELAPEFVNSEYVVLSRDFVDAVHGLGAKISCWTVDEDAAMAWVLGLGVDAVTTNRLGQLQRTVARRASQPDPAATAAKPGTPAGTTQTAFPVRPGSRLTGAELAEALEVAHALGEWAIEFTRTADRGNISTKANPADLVTEVDVAVERHVRAVISERFPEHDLVGEELGGAARPGIPCWYLDPVDGTTNLANSIPWTAFSLALAIDRDPVVGIVADPWRGDLFEAVSGHGARLNGTDLTIFDTRASDTPASDTPVTDTPVTDTPASDTPITDTIFSDTPVTDTIGSHTIDSSAGPLSGKVIGTELAAHLPWPGMLSLLAALGERHATLRVMGSGTLTLVGVAAGRGVGAVIGTFGPVDHLAAALIVQESGGVVLNADGVPDLFPRSGGIMAASAAAASELYELWREARRGEEVTA